ncbi:MAG: hypothetical protein U5L10_05060 [Candidatus Moranbacteria bacterium]|nr:hypothetical protein [Candidatus Moranbacteria bacterium]
MTEEKKKKSSGDEGVKEEKIESLQKMIADAEKTISSAKQMLAKLQGPESGQTYQAPSRNDEEGQVIYGTFDGQIMIGEDDKQYPVPANYASKSKLVENDLLKLTITPTGNFVYKQVGPVERRYLIGIVEKDEKGNYVVNVDGRRYKILLAAATYFKVEPGDEVTLVVPRDQESTWGALENVLRKADDISEEELQGKISERVPKEKIEEIKRSEQQKMQEEASGKEEKDEELEEEDEEARPSAIERLEKEIEEERKKLNSQSEDLEEELSEEELQKIKEEASYPAGGNSK